MEPTVSGAKAMLESLWRTAVQVGVPLAIAYLLEQLDVINASLSTYPLWAAVGAPVLAALMRKFVPIQTDPLGVGRTDVPAAGGSARPGTARP